MAKMEKNESNSCLQCNKNFSALAHLRTHVRKFHPDSADVLAPMKYKNRQNFLFPCSLCNKNFNHKRNLSSHMKIHYPAIKTPKSLDPNHIKNRRNSIKCPMCDHVDSIRKQLTEHIKRSHNIEISFKKKEFKSKKEFIKWKCKEESQTNSKFVIEKNHKFKGKKVTIFACHRSGNYIPSGKNLRHLKTQGSNKIGAYCPAGIKMTELLKDGRVYIFYTASHVGHQVEIGRLLITKEEKRNISIQIANDVPFDDILDGIRDTVTNGELKRIHLVTKKDLHNIKHSFHLTNTEVRRSSDAPSVEAFIDEMQQNEDCVLFYKPQGIMLAENSELKVNDFVLMLMNSEQAELLIKYGSDFVCLDVTYGLNYSFKLITLIVLDDTGEGFPCAYMITDRCDSDTLKNFIFEVKGKIGIIKPKTFMSDQDSSFYTAWTSIMEFPQKRFKISDETIVVIR